jgi:vacuolar iron transporter family protein
MNNFYLRSLVYGGTDGIITMFNIISGVEGAKMKYYIIFILGIGTLLADAVSMGFSDFLSINANQKQKNLSKSKNKKNNKINPVKHGLLTFTSFIIFGLIPLSSYLLYNTFSKNNNYLKTYISTLLALFILGSIQSKFTNEKWYKSGTYVAFYGIIASIISYSVGNIMSQIVPKSLLK